MHIFDATISNGNGWADLMSVQEDYKVKDINFKANKEVIQRRLFQAHGEEAREAFLFCWLWEGCNYKRRHNHDNYYNTKRRNFI